MSARADQPVVATAALVPLAVLLAAVPYVAPLLGFTLPLDPFVEVVDHVLPGVVITVAAGAALLMRRHPAAGYAFAVAAGVSLLGGLWATATHVPLLAQAQQGIVGWGAAVFHTTLGPVIIAVSLTALLPALRTAD